MIRFTPVLLCMALAAIPTDSYSQAQATVTGEDILSDHELSAEQLDELRNGQIVTFGSAEHEQTKRELAVKAVMIIEQPLERVLSALDVDASLGADKGVIAVRKITGETDFAEIGYSNEEIDEVENFLDVKPGGKFNFSPQEITNIQALGKELGNASTEQKVARASALFREMLLERYRSYRARGLDGIAGYARSKKEVVPVGEDLKLITEKSAESVSSRFPDYTYMLVEYPEGSDCCEHRFFWIKKNIEKRPAFVLVHRIIGVGPHRVLLTEREYYVSHTYNNSQVTLGWLPYGEDDTFVGLGISSSTDKVVKMATIAHRVGRGRIESIIESVLETMKDELATQ